MYQEAIADFTKVLELDSGNANAYFNRASTFDSQGAVALAIADYTRALELDAEGGGGSAGGAGSASGGAKAPRDLVPPTPYGR